MQCERLNVTNRFRSRYPISVLGGQQDTQEQCSCPSPDGGVLSAVKGQSRKSLARWNLGLCRHS